MNRRVALALVLVLFSSELFAQNTQQPIFRAGVEVIEVDVSVVDSRGRPITDMLGPEFTVTVDGKPRHVVSAQYVSLRQPLGPGGRRVDTDKPDVAFSSNAARTQGRLVVIAIDRENIAFGSGREVAPAARKFLDTLGPDDKVAFVTVPLGPQVGFTSNHQLIRTELARMVGVAHRPRIDLNIGITEAFAINEHTDPQLEAEVINRFCSQFRTGSTEAQSCELNVRAQAGAIVHEEHIRADGAIKSLQAILELLRDIDGPKSIVWISQGLVTSRGGNELSGLERLADAARATINVIMLDAPLVDVSEAEKSPTQRDDRDLEVQGLEILAGRTRGALYRASVSANAAFRRMEEELSGYYLLGVEANPSDRDGKRHPIKVSVRRQGASLRSRREFQFGETRSAKNESIEERIQRALAAPFAATELPMRVATYAYQDTGSSKVRILIATEIDGRDLASTDVTMGFTLTDREGRVAASGMQKKTLASVAGPDGPLCEDAGALLVEPGSYTLKLAMIDARGRRGSIEHPVQAFQMTGVPFAVGDLLLAETPMSGADGLRPPVEARIATGRLATYMELYAADAAAFGAMTVRIEVAARETGPALVSGNGVLNGAGAARTVAAVVPVGALPPGPYVARAIVARGDQKIGQLSRPFQITTTSAAAAVTGTASTAPVGAALLASMLRPPDPFRKDDLLEAATLGVFMDALDKGRPALKAITAQVRRGTFAGAARAALDADDQLASMFLRGLELLAGGQLTQAATQFTGALRMSPDFAPASFYLGACYAAGGRDQEAVAAWKEALGGGLKTAAGYASLGDALLRLRDGEQAVAVLAQASAAYPDHAALRRRLAVAQALSLKHRDALASVDAYLARNPGDEDALLIALHAIYAARVGGQPILERAEERERMEKYGRAYTAAKGRHVDLIRTWVEYISK